MSLSQHLHIPLSEGQVGTGLPKAKPYLFFLAQDTRKSLDMVQVQLLEKKKGGFGVFLGSEGLGGMWLARGG